MVAALTIVFLIAVVPITGVLLAVTPYLMPKRECFAVTVPELAHADPVIRGLKKRYALLMLAVSAVATLVVALPALPVAATGASEADYWIVWVAIAAMFVPMFASFGLMLRFRRKVMAVKRERGWFAPRQEATAIVAEQDVPGAISLSWNLLYVPVILLTVAIAAFAYPSMPDMIPMHADFNGNVTRYEPKSPFTVGFPVLIDLFLAACFILCHVIMLRSKRPTHPGAPATSALAYGLFARAQSVFLLATGVLLCAVMSLVFMLSSLEMLSLGAAAAIIIVACIPVVVGAVALSVIYGQAGSRLFSRMQQQAEGAEGAVVELMPLDDDKHWKLGIIYYNPDDASLWLPERFGIGWTMNFARPAAWAIVGGFTALTLVFVGVCFLVAG